MINPTRKLDGMPAARRHHRKGEGTRAVAITSALHAVPSEVWPTKGTAGTAYCAAALAVCPLADP
jgi:hypothetical protein